MKEAIRALPDGEMFCEVFPCMPAGLSDYEAEQYLPDIKRFRMSVSDLKLLLDHLERVEKQRDGLLEAATMVLTAWDAHVV